MTLAWPQISYLALIFLGSGFYLAKHGQPKEGTYNFGVALASDVLVLWLLWSGGFFS